MASEKLTEIELSGIELHERGARFVSKDCCLPPYLQEDDVETEYGSVHVIIEGDRHKPAIFTYHDIGLNSTSCFQGFFNYPGMQQILRHFCVYHLNAPGQHEGASLLPLGSKSKSKTNTTAAALNYTFPNMDQLSDMVVPVMDYYGVKTFIGFGVGAGANILARFALRYPEKTDALVLINCTSCKASWSEWAYQKKNLWHLKSGTITAAVEEYLLWHWFGKKTMATNHDLMTVYMDYLKSVNPFNLAAFMESYIARDDLNIWRNHVPDGEPERKFKCQIMMVTGEHSPHLDDTVEMNARLDPTNSTWMKFSCGGMVQEEVPEKLTEAFRLFLQGMGYVPGLSQAKLVAEKSATSLASEKYLRASSSKNEQGDRESLIHRISEMPQTAC